LMAGVVVGAFANSVIMLVLGTSPANVVRDAVWWMMGSVAAATWAQDAWLLAYLVLGGGALFAWARRIDVLALGDDTAAALGLDPERASRRVYAGAALVAAATVSAAGLVGFVGPNGSGKSTLVRALLGRVVLAAGRLLVDGEDVQAHQRATLAKRIAVVTQREELVFPIGVEEYVALGRFPHLGGWRGARAADREAVARAMARAGVDALARDDRQVQDLSGGEWQRVRLARALAQEGEALVLDEPTTFLDG